MAVISLRLLVVLDKTIGTPTNGQTITADVNLVSPGGSTATITLPTPSAGKQVTVKKVDAAAGTVVVQRNAAETIDGAASKTLYYQYESLTVISDGTNWFII